MAQYKGGDLASGSKDGGTPRNEQRLRMLADHGVESRGDLLGALDLCPGERHPQRAGGFLHGLDPELAKFWSHGFGQDCDTSRARRRFLEEFQLLLRELEDAKADAR